MNIVTIGTGYVGLVTGTCFAEFGFNVTCVDKDQSKIEGLKQGQLPIYEPGLEPMVTRLQESGMLTFTTSLGDAVAEADVVFIAVGTPQDDDGSADLQYVHAAAAELAPFLSGYTVVVNKSTVPVGTAREVENIIRQNNPTADFDVASNPEFLREGSAVDDCLRPERVIVGTDSERAMDMVRTLYMPLEMQGTPMVATTPETAELTKYAANAFLATKISFINQIARLCDGVGADVLEVARGMGLDGRIGAAFLNPGPGYGGSCFPKDTSALAKIAQDANTPLGLVEATQQANTEHKKAMAAHVKSILGDKLEGKTIAVLGLAFKANTDDMRDAPALDILPVLADAGARLVAYDPEAMENATDLLPMVGMAASVDLALKDADGALILTEWGQFKSLQAEAYLSHMKTPLVVDLRNLYNPLEMHQAGVDYHGLGRGGKRALAIAASHQTFAA